MAVHECAAIGCLDEVDDELAEFDQGVVNLDGWPSVVPGGCRIAIRILAGAG
jgi:hypothetical protein